MTSHARHTFVPSYVALHASGELAQRVRAAYENLAACTLCYRRCRVDRRRGPAGFCRSGPNAMVASWTAHMWEEPPITGIHGSGTIFFSNCTGKCIFCQNYSISQLGVGQPVTTDRLARIMLDLQRRGCHNINLVTPTHYVPAILAALDVATDLGLRIPIVYNTNGYDSLECLQLLDGVVDIYLPDAKYADDRVAARLSGFHKYVEANRICLKEMYRQLGDKLLLDDRGIALRGLIIRHLVLPNNMAQTADVLRWIARELSPHVHVNVMSQYFPTYKAIGHPIIGRRITLEEYEQALDAFDAAGLQNGWGQNMEDDTDEILNDETSVAG